MKQPALVEGVLPIAGGWNWTSFKVPSNPNQSMIIVTTVMLVSHEWFQEDVDPCQRATEEGSKRMTAKYRAQFSGTDG